LGDAPPVVAGVLMAVHYGNTFVIVQVNLDV
jgi:hypothetical protein